MQTCSKPPARICSPVRACVRSGCINTRGDDGRCKRDGAAHTCRRVGAGRAGGAGGAALLLLILAGWAGGAVTSARLLLKHAFRAVGAVGAARLLLVLA